MGSIHLYGKNVENSYFGHLLQLIWNLMVSIRPLSRHKLAKWADRKSKMAATAALLKINFGHLFPYLWWPWAKTCSVATGWLLDGNKLKLCQSEIQDGHNGSAPLNKMATRAKNRKSSNNISSLTNGLISKYLCRSVPPMAFYQNCLNGSAWLNRMAARAKNRKSFKWHLLRSQCPDFKVISQKCSSYGPLPKLLKKFRSAEQNGHKS